MISRIDWIPMASVIPEGKQGAAEIVHYTIGESEHAYTRMRAAATGGREQPIPQGQYCRLMINGYVMMSDTPAEQRENTGFIVNATGDVLIAGLGIGMVIIPLLAKTTVKSVFVVEKSHDVIDLVEAPLRKELARRFGEERSYDLGVMEADIFDWEPPKGEKWDTIYFDIWAGKCTDNLKQMAKLHQKFGRRKTSKDAWMDSWCKSLLQYWKSQGR